VAVYLAKLTTRVRTLMELLFRQLVYTPINNSCMTKLYLFFRIVGVSLNKCFCLRVLFNHYIIACVAIRDKFIRYPI
jgi:hypothetical protein